GEAQPEAAARIAAAPRFQGATPANPFGDAAFDLFDAVEAGPAEAATVTAAAPAPSEIPAAAAPQPEPIATAAPAAPDTTEPVAAPPADPAAPPAVPAGPIASIEIKPIVVDEVIAEAPKKRGWWRR
ncbi:ribonuclease E/G, partial [Elioraea sp. Yellowstone]